MLKELQELTSLWDYFHKCEQDKDYEAVAIRGYKSDTYNPPPYTFEMAKAWLEKWVIDSVRAGYEETCLGMVNYLNRQIRQINVDILKIEMARQAKERQAQRMGQTIQEAIETARQEAQRTGQPVITAQQTPPTHTDWITTTPFTVRYAPINPQFYGTITIDNEGVRQTRPNPIDPPPMTPQPPIENLWGDIPEPPGGVPAAENNPFTPPGHPDNPTGQTQPNTFAPPTDRPPRPGDMTEYGWFDPEIEREIETLVHQQNLNREDAIIRVFNEDNGARILPITLPTNEREPGDMRPANTLMDENDYEIEWDYTPAPPEDDPRMDR